MERRFQTYFTNKGILGSIAEKAIHNYKSKIQIDKKIYYHDLYDFTVGHFIKQINRKLYFDFQYDEIDKKEIPTKNLSLLRSRFSFFKNDNGNFKKDNDCLLELIENIRNINAHFIHIFDYIEITAIHDNVLKLIKEAYKLAAISIKFRSEIEDSEKINRRFLTINEKDNLFSSLLKTEGQIISFLKKLHSIDQSITFDSLDDLIESILYIEVKEQFCWKVNKNGDGSENNHVHDVLEIKAGKYLSFEGALFILNMFLFRNESNYISGKSSIIKNEDDKIKTDKLRLYIAFSKKFSSQDINPERQNLVQFRDIVQYLTKVPQAWNQFMVETPDSQYTSAIMENLIEFEVDKKYGEVIKHFPDFRKFCKNYLFEGIIDVSIPNYQLYSDFINKSDKFKKIYFDLLEGKIKSSRGYTLEMYIASYILNEFIFRQGEPYDDIRNKKFKTEDKLEFEKLFNENLKLDKLKSRIESKVLIDSYKRNKDKYLQYALSYLMECEYFGMDAQIKMHKYMTMEEQAEEIEHLEEELQYLKKTNFKQYENKKKEFDKLKYHQGKLIIFRTLNDHKSLYPNWRFPYVVQDNSVVIKIPDIDMPITIQKDLMVYLLDHALNSSNATERGRTLLRDYTSTLLLERNALLYPIRCQSIDTPIKTKILPRHLVKKVNDPKSEKSLNQFYKNIKLRLETDHKKYKIKKDIAIQKGVEEEFLKNNKGKSYKFRFIFRAWQIMYFKPKYLQVKGEKHHKHYNITKAEFHDLAKWMYAFDMSANYKNNILELARSKGFEQSDKIIQVIKESMTFDQLFERTKKLYDSFLFNLDIKSSNEKYSLSNYDEMKMFSHGNININISHFRDYLKKADQLINFKISSELAKSVLIESNYMSFNDILLIKNIKEKRNNSTASELRLIEKLRKIKLQDAQLYKIAQIYLLKEDKIKKMDQTKITEFLNVDLKIEICNGQDILVPFKLINKYEEIRHSSEMLEKGYSGSSILLNFNTFYNKFKNEPSLNSINIAKLELSDVSKLINVMVLKQAKFTDIMLGLEEFYIWKDRLTIDNFNIPIKKILGLSKYFNEDYKLRNKPFHFNFLADKDYDEEVRKFEKLFFTTHVTNNDLLQAKPMVQNMIRKFINQIYNKANDLSKQDKLHIESLETNEEKKTEKIRIIFQQYLKQRSRN